MSKYIKRLLGKTTEEAMVVQAKITKVRCQTAQPTFTDLILEWTRGDTIETSAPFGEILNGQVDLDLAIIFNKLSIFFRQAPSGSAPALYQEKRSTLSLFSQVSN